MRFSLSISLISLTVRLCYLSKFTELEKSRARLRRILIGYDAMRYRVICTLIAHALKPCAYETIVNRIEYLTEHDECIIHIVLLGDDQRK